MKEKILIFAFLSFVIFAAIEVTIFKKIYYIPQAGIYVQQVRRNDLVDNYYSRGLLPLLFRRYMFIDTVRMNHFSEIGCYAFLDCDNLILYLMDDPGNGDYNNFLSFSEYNMKIIRYYPLDLDDWDRFYDGHNLSNPYALIHNCQRFGLGFDVRPARKVHLYYLFKVPSRNRSNSYPESS